MIEFAQQKLKRKIINNTQSQSLSMNCNKYLQFIFFVVLIAWGGYLMLTIYVLPISSFFEWECLSQYYDDTPINLRLGDWILGNMYAEIGSSFLLSFIQAGLEHRGCACLIFVGLLLFEIVWSIIGFMIFNNHYKDDCAQSGSINNQVTTALYYGIILFPLMLILIIVTIIGYSQETSSSQVVVLNEPVDSGIISPLNQQDPPVPQPSNVFKRLARRLYASFDQNSIN